MCIGFHTTKMSVNGMRDANSESRKADMSFISTSRFLQTRSSIHSFCNRPKKTLATASS